MKNVLIVMLMLPKTSRARAAKCRQPLQSSMAMAESSANLSTPVISLPTAAPGALMAAHARAPGRYASRKITPGEMGASGVRGVLAYCADKGARTRLASSRIDGRITMGPPKPEARYVTNSKDAFDPR